MKRPLSTIWGKVDFAEQVEGLPIWRVATPSHGGYVVEREWATAHLTASAIAIGDGDYGANGRTGPLYFEEDCNWLVLAWEVPDIDRCGYDLTDLTRCIASYVPDYDINSIAAVPNPYAA
jgi:hypothetical protein